MITHPKFINNKRDPEQMDEQAKLNKICLNRDCGHSWYAHWARIIRLHLWYAFVPNLKYNFVMGRLNLVNFPEEEQKVLRHFVSCGKFKEF